MVVRPDQTTETISVSLPGVHQVAELVHTGPMEQLACDCPTYGFQGESIVLEGTACNLHYCVLLRAAECQVWINEDRDSSVVR